MKHDKQNPRERILDSAFHLFRDQGYAETGISEILTEAGAYKKSLYDHFTSKEDLAVEYLASLTHSHADLIERVAATSEDLERFTDRWVDLVRRSLKHSKRQDCPIGLFAGEVASIPEMRPHVLETIDRLIRTMQRSVQQIIPLPDAEAENLARRVFVAFQGGMRLFYLTGEERYLTLMREELKHIARSVPVVKG